MQKSFFYPLICLTLIACTRDRAPDTPITQPAPKTLATDAWTYIEVDSAKAMWGEYDDPEWLRYFGLDAGDLNGDGMLDIVSGRTVYLNPGGNMAGNWRKVDLGRNVDGNRIISYRGRPAVLGEALPDVVLYETDGAGQLSEGRVVAQVPPTGHHNGQGYKVAELVAGNGVEEVIYASQGGLYAMVPQTNEREWPVMLVGKDASDEGFGVADMDGDGDQDLISGFRVPGKDAEVPTVVVWFENPGGELTEGWTRHEVGNTEFATDRVEAADLNGDGLTDVVVAEERYPGEEPDASLYVYLQTTEGFDRNTIVTQYSMNNLSLPDLDGDGDRDILTAEHKGPDLSLQLWENDGAATFSKQEIDRGKESHLGTQAYDMDGDGDLDIVSIGWDRHQFVHLWRNDAVRAK